MDETTTTGRRGFMVGAAGLAAGAALLGGSSPAGAQTLDDYDFAPYLKSIESNVPEDVDLGTGGAVRADFVGEGDIAAMTFRLIVGTGADLGVGFWAILASSFPTDFTPVEQPDPTGPPPADPSPFPLSFGWQGTGIIVNSGNTAGSSVIAMLERFPGGPTFLGFGLIGPTGIGGLNEGGDNPFEFDAGTLLTATIVYRRIVPEV